MAGTRHGGIGRYVLELVTHIACKDKENEYCLFLNSDAPEELLSLPKSYANFKNILVNIRHYSVKEQLLLPNILNRHNLDLVHFPNFNVPILYKKPFVVTIHDAVHHKISGAKKSRLPHFYAYKKVMEHAVSASRRIITVSTAAKKELVEILFAKPEKVVPIYEASSLKDTVSEDEVAEVKKRFTLNRPYFLFVGVMERKKNLLNLRLGFEEFLRQYGLDMDLVLAGPKDAHYPAIKNEILKSPHADRLVLTGYVSERQLRCLYKGAHAFVSASLHEGFGLPGLEAMNFGLPLAVSNIEVFNEIYDNAAVYFDPNDTGDIAEKLYLLSRDHAFHNQMQEKSFNRGQDFSWEKTAAETCEVYREALIMNHGKK